MTKVPAAPIAKILQITDMHILPNAGETLLGVDTELTFHATIEQALTEIGRIDLVLVTGDLAQHPCPSSYQRIQSKLDSIEVPSLCLPGNHDDYDLMQRHLNLGFVSCCKRHFIKNWQIICLNSQIPESPRGHISIEELSFLGGCLQESQDNPTIIAIHHHSRKTGSNWMDTMLIDNRAELDSILAQHAHVKAVICGHIHQEMDIQAGSIRFLGTPSTCFQFKPASEKFGLDDSAPGYRLINLYADGSFDSKVSRSPTKLTGLLTSADTY